MNRIDLVIILQYYHIFIYFFPINALRMINKWDIIGMIQGF